MAVVKVSVAIDETDLAWARKRAKRDKASLSSVLSEAVRHRRQMEARDAVLADITRHQPPGSPEEIAAIAREWGAHDAGAGRHASVS